MAPKNIRNICTLSKIKSGEENNQKEEEDIKLAPTRKEWEQVAQNREGKPARKIEMPLGPNRKLKKKQGHFY